MYAGVDYHANLERAQPELDVLVWDGGNNDLPFYRPDLHRCGRRPAAGRYRVQLPPGEANARLPTCWSSTRSTRRPRAGRRLEEQLKQLNADAVVVKRGWCLVSGFEDSELVTGKRVLVIEDGRP